MKGANELLRTSTESLLNKQMETNVETENMDTSEHQEQPIIAAED